MPFSDPTAVLGLVVLAQEIQSPPPFYKITGPVAAVLIIIAQIRKEGPAVSTRQNMAQLFAALPLLRRLPLAHPLCVIVTFAVARPDIQVLIMGR